MVVFSVLKKYRKENAIFKVLLFLRWLVSPYAELEKQLPADCEVIDVGCGYGMFANYLSLVPTRKILGIDISKTRISCAQSSIGNRNNLSFRLADISQGSLPESDFITIIDVLHHLPEAMQEDVLKKSFLSLKNGGVILIKDVDIAPRIKYYINYAVDSLTDFLNFTEGAAYCYRSSQDFKRLIEEMGFKNVEVQRVRKFDLFAHIIIKGEKKK